MHHAIFPKISDRPGLYTEAMGKAEGLWDWDWDRAEYSQNRLGKGRFALVV